MKILTSTLLLLYWTCGLSVQAQVTNIRSNHDAINDKYIITYDLAKENRYNYFDIDIIANISGIEVRPSLAALSGDMGLNIKYGSKKRIVWDYLIDIEKVVGEVDFKIQARRPAIPAPPSQSLDIAVGSSLAGVGLGLAAYGGLTILKKNRIDIEATPGNDPLVYYYTFCDSESQYFNTALAEVEDENSASICDSHFTEANEQFKKGVRFSTIGGILVAGGLYALLAKPFYKPKMKAYRKKHGLTFTPTFDWQQSPNQSPQGVVGLRLSYQFGQ